MRPIKEYCNNKRKSIKPEQRRIYDMRYRKTLKKYIENIYDALDGLPNAQLSQIFTDDYIEKMLKISEKVLDVAEWKLSEGEVGAIESKTFPKMEQVKYEKKPKLEKKFVAPQGFELEDDKNPFSKLIYKPNYKDKKISRRELILINHLKEMEKHYLSVEAIEAHKELKHEFGFPDTLQLYRSNIKSKYDACLLENAQLKKFIELYNLQKEWKYAKEQRLRQILKEAVGLKKS